MESQTPAATRARSGGFVPGAPGPADILKAVQMDVVPYAHRIAALAERLGLDLSATLFALNAIPLCLPRADHAPQRRDMAALIAAHSPQARTDLPGLVAGRLAPLSQPGRVELMGQVVLPLVSDLLGLLVGVAVDTSHSQYLSRVFSQSLGPARRRVMEAELREALRQLREGLPAADDHEIGLRLALLILGRDALAGTLSLSLHALMQDGRAFAAPGFPETPPRTGVPYIDRVAVAAFDTADGRVEPGQVLRAWLRDYETSADPRARLAFFGGGAHLCLGRALSLDLWREIGAVLARTPGHARVLDLVMRPDDVFSLPERLMIEVLPE